MSLFRLLFCPFLQKGIAEQLCECEERYSGAMHLIYSPTARKLRFGVYEVKMVERDVPYGRKPIKVSGYGTTIDYAFQDAFLELAEARAKARGAFRF